MYAVPNPQLCGVLQSVAPPRKNAEHSFRYTSLGKRLLLWTKKDDRIAGGKHYTIYAGFLSA